MALSGLVLRNCTVYAPECLGSAEVAVLERRVFSCGGDAWRALKDVPGVELQEVDCEGGMVLPGLVDIHLHFGGAGGEGGPIYRTPPLQLSDLARAGITSAVGLLGTDGCCRSLRDLLMKARALDEEGVSTWIYTGAYQIPGPTLTGDILSDLMLIDKVVGLKISCSDHRASQVSPDAIRTAAAQSRVGGIMAGKSGAVMVHIGVGNDRLLPLLQAAAESDIPLTQFIPTHLNRSEDVLRQAIAYALEGGRVDLTSGVSERCCFPGAVKPSLAAAELLRAGVPLEHISMSSDGNGVMTKIDEKNGSKQPLMAPAESLLQEFLDMIREGIPPETASRICSANPAGALQLPGGKGHIREGGDADLLVLDRDLNLRLVLARGRKLLEGNWVAKGTFER